jgi:hypothetical protein
VLRLLAFGLVLFAAACASDATAPRQNALVGEWGGTGLRLTTDGSSVHAELQCDAADFRAPLVPNESGEFVLPGTVSRAKADVQIGARGVLSGAVITVEVIRWFPGGSNVQQFTVVRDKPADLSGVCAL